MSLKIVCPSCTHSMVLKTYKAGRFKPKCSSCGLVFSLIISDDNPPTTKVSPLPDATPSIPKTVVDQTIVHEPTLPRPVAKTIAATDQTVDQTIMVDKPQSQIGANLRSVDKKVVSKAVALNPVIPNTGGQIATSKLKPSVAPKLTGDPGGQAGASIPSRLGGYRIVNVLGQGGMGSVYLAKQISLDRSVALKTIQPKWAASPRVIARFIREAYAAAQLTHHNVVQIYDLGEDAGTNFFSMELVSGGSLEDLLAKKGTLQSKTASMLILQAARGLKFAHDHGMVHRDIKPANLMLTNDGMLKVADLGLVKTPAADDDPEGTSPEDRNLMLASARANVTYQGSTMGTPAYMSPEQAYDASTVDHRADIYSLGCTFYALLTGRPPFVSNTIIEILSKHKAEKMPRPETIVHDAPGVLGDIIDKMTAKRPEDRYQDLQHTIYDIEVFLGLADADESEYRSSSYSGIGPISVLANQAQSSLPNARPDVTSIPVSQLFDSQNSQLESTGGDVTMPPQSLSSPDQSIAIVTPLSQPIAAKNQKIAGVSPSEIAALTSAAKKFAASPLRYAQQLLPVGFIGLMVLLSVLFLFSSFSISIALLVVAITAMIGAMTVGQQSHRSPLAQRIVRTVKSNSITDWIYQVLGFLLLAIATYSLGMWGTILIASIVGFALGVGYFYGIEESLRKTRAVAVQSIEGTLKQMRLRGLSEKTVRASLLSSSRVCRDRLIESVFGYDVTRQILASTKGTPSGFISGLSRITHLTDRLRDLAVDRLDIRLADVQRMADQKVLAKAERASLIASGMNATEASKRAAKAAEGMVDVASETKQALAEINRGNLTAEEAAEKRARIKRMMAEARSGQPIRSSLASRSLQLLLEQLLGGKMRFVLGAFLLTGFALWAQQNEIFSPKLLGQAFDQAKQIGQDAISTDTTAIDKTNAAIQSTKALVDSILNTNTKPLAWPVIGSLFNGFSPAIAGIIMILSSVLGGWKLSLTMLPAALIMVAGPLLGIPAVGSILSAQALSITIGLAIAVAGYWGIPKNS